MGHKKNAPGPVVRLFLWGIKKRPKACHPFIFMGHKKTPQGLSSVYFYGA